MVKKNSRIKQIKLNNIDRFGYMVMADIRLRKPQPIKNVEIILQEIIEKVYGGCWWQHTDRNIFMDLLGGYAKDLRSYIFGILMPSLY